MTEGAITYDPLDDSYSVTPPGEDDDETSDTKKQEIPEPDNSEIPF